MKCCTDVFGIPLTATTLKIIFHAMSSSAGGHFGIFLGPLWCVVFYFLGTIQCFSLKPVNFSQISKNFMAPFYGLRSTVSRLQSHFEETVNPLPLSHQKALLLVFF